MFGSSWDDKVDELGFRHGRSHAVPRRTQNGAPRSGARRRFRDSLLALRLLEAGAGRLLAVLLALFGALVAGDHAGCLQGGAQGDVDLHQRARDAVANGAGLAGESAARAGRVHIVLADGLRDLERLVEHAEENVAP